MRIADFAIFSVIGDNGILPVKGPEQSQNCPALRGGKESRPADYFPRLAAQYRLRRYAIGVRAGNKVLHRHPQDAGDFDGVFSGRFGGLGSKVTINSRNRDICSGAQFFYDNTLKIKLIPQVFPKTTSH
jgi:hypothetical protein